MPNPDISIVIPTYQRRDLVLTLLKGIACQDFAGSFEVIVAIDGSRDGTAEAVKTLRPDFPLKVIEQPNLGLARARNDDDLWASDKLRCQMEALRVS